MSKKMRLSQEFIEDITHSKVVIDALAAKQKKVSNAAEMIASTEGIEGEIELSTGERPKYNRPYARVLFTNGAQEHGTSNVERRRVLGRAIHGA